MTDATTKPHEFFYHDKRVPVYDKIDGIAVVDHYERVTLRDQIRSAVAGAGFEIFGAEETEAKKIAHKQFIEKWEKEHCECEECCKTKDIGDVWKPTLEQAEEFSDIAYAAKMNFECGYFAEAQARVDELQKIINSRAN